MHQCRARSRTVVLEARRAWAIPAAWPVLWVLTLVPTPPASAHLEIQAGRSPYIDATGAIVGGYTSWGVVLPPSEGSGFLRVCEESYDPSPAGVATASFSVLRDDGAVLLGGYLGTFVSRDAGCTLEPVAAPLSGRASSSAVRAGSRLFVATFDPQTPNGVFVSDDGGDAWREALAPMAGISLFRMATNLDGSRVVATGTVSALPAAPAVFLSEDGGASWMDLSSTYAAFDIVTAGGFDEDGETLLLGGTQLAAGQYQGHVLEAAPPYTAPVTLGLFPSQVSHVVAAQGARFAVLPLRSELYTQSARTSPFVKTHDLDPMSPEPAGPTDCVGVKPDGIALYGCAKQHLVSPGLFLESADGVTWSSAVAFDDVGYRSCPVGSVGAAKCASYVETLCGDGVDNDFDGATDCEDPDCGACVGRDPEDGREEEAEREEGDDSASRARPGRPAGCSAGGPDAGAGVTLGMLALRTWAHRCGRRILGLRLSHR